MPKKLTFIIAIGLAFITGSLGYAASLHSVSVNVASYARVSVSGAASIILTINDIQAGTDKNFESSVEITMNANRSCQVIVTTTGFEDSSSLIGNVQAKVDASGQTYHTLSTSGVTLAEFGNKLHNITYDVLFKLVNVSNLSSLSKETYSTTVEYTAVATL